MQVTRLTLDDTPFRRQDYLLDNHYPVDKILTSTVKLIQAKKMTHGQRIATLNRGNGKYEHKPARSGTLTVKYTDLPLSDTNPAVTKLEEFIRREYLDAWLFQAPLGDIKGVLEQYKAALADGSANSTLFIRKDLIGSV